MGGGLFGSNLRATSVVLEDNTHVEGEVYLVGAQIRGPLLCAGAHLSNPGGDALTASGLNATTVLLVHTKVEGGVRLEDAQISGKLDCSDARLMNPEGMAFSAASMSASDVFLRGTHAEGEVDLQGAYLSGLLRCSEGAKLINSGGIALSADRLMAANGVLISNTRAEGEMRLEDARISRQLVFSGTELHNPNGNTLSAQGCQVGGEFFFSLAEAAVGTVDLARAEVGTLADDLASWPDTYNLEGFSYHSLDDADMDRRLEWISKSVPFSLDVYRQLAEIYRSSGEGGHARKVLIAGERARRQDTKNLWRWAWNLFLGATVRYGYEPWRAVWFLMVLFALGWLLFAQPPARNAIVPAPQNERVPANATENDCKNYPCFSPLVYSLDTLLPIIDFHQESNWVPSSDQTCGKYQVNHYWYQFPTWLSNRVPSGWPCGKWYEWLTWILIGAGWFLTTAVVAGIGSLWRRE